MPTTTKPGTREQFPCVRTMRFTHEQEAALRYAIKVTPGCGTFAGVIRIALDDWIERNYGDQLTQRKQHA